VGFDPPVLLVISPTMRCNLQCYGCYAGRYSRTDDLGLGTFERLLYEAEAMGIYFITVSGGEPFMLGDDFLTILGRHRSILFQIYTNGMLIDRGTAARLAQIGNAYPCISVEGFQKETDARRGDGAFKKVLDAMKALKEEGVVFGFSATATRENNDLIVSERFINFFREKGCVVGWYFHYVPVGKKPGIELMPTAEQRLFRREELVKRRARHDILQSPFFTEIRRRQPYDDNLLRPCMIIDVPEVLREVVTVCGAHPTHYGADAVINELAQDMDRYSETYHRMADTKWCEYQSKNGK